VNAAIGQDYAQHDLLDGSENSDDQHHTGVDIGALAGTPVYAAAKGRVVLLQKVKALGEDRDHGYGNTIILYHPSAGFYTQYSHLQSIDERLVNGCQAQQVFSSRCLGGVEVDPDDPARSIIGQVGASASGQNPYIGDPNDPDDDITPHLHFELKRFATLGTSDNEYGYTPKHPDTYGYCDPLIAYHAASDTLALAPGTRLRVTERGCGASLRVGPGALPNGVQHRSLKGSTSAPSSCDERFRTSVIGAVETGDVLEIRGTAGKTISPACDGWYRVEAPQSSHNTEAVAEGHYFKDATRPKNKSGVLSTIPDAWICAGQNGECPTGKEVTCWLSPITTNAAITIPSADVNRETVKKVITVLCELLSRITYSPRTFCEAIGFALIPDTLSSPQSVQSEETDTDLPPPTFAEVASKVRTKLNKRGHAKLKVKLNKQGKELLKARGGSLTVLVRVAIVDKDGRTVTDAAGQPITTQEVITIKRP
jgi:murein DD-endopeptidase MepM/ murein hydrolase activator NlpD